MSELQPGDRVVVLDPRVILGRDGNGIIDDLIGNEYILDHRENGVFWVLKDCFGHNGINERLLEKVECSPSSPINDDSLLSCMLV